MAIDLAVLGRDPLFGGGGFAQTEAFLDAAEELGYAPTLLFDPHPGLRGPRLTPRRVEALRQLAWSRHALDAASRLWVVSTHATDGGPAQRSGRPYDAWIGTTVEAEFAGRARGLAAARRVAAGLSAPPLRALERRVLLAARRLYATSPSSRTEVEAASGRDDVGVLPIPVDVGRFTPASQPPADRHALFVGRANDPRKNVGLLLAAARLTPQLAVELVGIPPEGPLPANVVARGPVEDLPEAMRRASVLVIPSWQEGFGIVAAEALASGVPVVTTPCGGPEELVRRSGGGAVLEGFSSEELATALGALLGDDETRARLGASGRAYVEREHSQARFRELLAEALA